MRLTTETHMIDLDLILSANNRTDGLTGRLWAASITIGDILLAQRRQKWENIFMFLTWVVVLAAMTLLLKGLLR